MTVTAPAPLPVPVSTGEGLMVSGEAFAKATPDVIEVVVNLQTVAATATQALRDSASQMQKAAIGHTSVQNLSMTVAPLYGPPGSGAQPQSPQLVGYQVTNAFKLSVRDLSQVGPMLEALGGGAAQAGCAMVFKVNDESRIRREVLEAAVKDARSKADILAAAAGRQIDDLVYLNEEVAAPTNSGDLTIRARVVAAYRFR